MIAEGKASDKKIYVKKLQEKRTAINIIYNMTTEKNGKRGVLAIAAEPAGPKDTTVESEPANAQSQKLKVSTKRWYTHLLIRWSTSQLHG